MTVNTHQLLTVAQAKRSPLSESAIRARIERREIEAVKIGGSIFLDEAELIAKLGPEFYTPRPKASQ